MRGFIEELGYSEELCYNTDLVVSEALTNVMLHGFKNNRPEPTQLTLFAFEHGVGVLVEDSASPIPQDVLNSLCDQSYFKDDLELSEVPEGGMGLVFMHLVSKRFLYHAEAGRNRLFMLL